jgi:hypothetical protein
MVCFIQKHWLAVVTYMMHNQAELPPPALRRQIGQRKSEHVDAMRDVFG